MEVTAHNAFIAMYHALKAATDKYPDQGLKTLVEDANPFIWKDHPSADTAVWTEFSAEFDERYKEGTVSPEVARSFCKSWLARQAQRHEFYRGPLFEAFDSVATPREWAAAFNELTDNTD